MEYMNQGALPDFLRKRRELPLDQKILLMLHITTGLVFLHGNGILHRDLKGSNILVSDSHGLLAKISDLGSRKIQDFEQKISGELCGTPGWIAPEIFKNIPIQQLLTFFLSALFFGRYGPMADTL